MSDDTPTQRLPEGTTPPQPPAAQPAAQPAQSADVPTQHMDDLPLDATRILPADQIPQPHAFGAVHEDPVVAPYVPLAEPTEMLAPPPAAPAPAPGTAPAEKPRRRNPLLIALIAVSAVLLVAVAALLVTLLGGDRTPEAAPTAPETSATPDAEPTPSVSAEPEPSEEPEPSAPSTPVAPPPPPPGTVESFTASITAVPCAGVGSVPVEFSWRTNGDSVTFSVGYVEAENGPYETGLPASGSIVVDYQCGREEGEQVYSIAAYAGGSVVGRETVVLWDQ